jgi:ribosomal protein S18 acetylase RimI-like enzyme
LTKIRGYRPHDQGALIELWELCDLVRPWNVPQDDIAAKIAFQPDLLRVVDGSSELGGIVGSVMAGYEGHRGWINYLAVHPKLRRGGLGRELMVDAERRLRALGCPKINLQVRTSNPDVLAFYKRLGYSVDETVSMGKRLDGR